MRTVRHLALAVMLAAISAVSSHAQETPPPADGAAPPAEAAPVLDDVVPDAAAGPTVTAPKLPEGNFQKPARTAMLPDGRWAMLFLNGDNLPPVPEGFVRRDGPDGQVIYVTKLDPSLIPDRVRMVVRADGPYKLIATGAVASHDPIIEVPYRHVRVFRLTEDHVVKALFGKEAVLAPAGTMGFSAGVFGSTRLGSRNMSCYFPKSETINYEKPVCGLGYGNRTDVVFELVNTYGNLPVSYSVTTVYGASTAPTYVGFKSVTTSDKIPYDFRLTLRFVKWSKKGVVLNWGSGGGVVQEETYPLNDQGVAVVAFSEGTLTVTPDKKDKKAATVAWTAKESAAR